MQCELVSGYVINTDRVRCSAVNFNSLVLNEQWRCVHTQLIRRIFFTTFVCPCSYHVHGKSGSVRRQIVPDRRADAGTDRSRRQTGVGVLGRHRWSMLHYTDGTAVLRRFCSPGSCKQRLPLMNNQHHLTNDLSSSSSSSFILMSVTEFLSYIDTAWGVKRKQSIYTNFHVLLIIV